MNKKLKYIILSVFIVIAGYLGVNESMNFNYNKIGGNNHSSRPTLAIINSGANIDQVNYSMHINLTAFNAINGSTNIYDEDGLGTQLFAALFNDRFSLNSSNDVLLIKAYDNKDSINEENMLRAIDFAIENHADVINITAPLQVSEGLNQAMNRARGLGIIVTMPLSEYSQEFISTNGLTSVVSLNSELRGDVAIDDTHSITCVNNRCNVNQSNELNSIYASEYILRNGIENPRNLVINTIFNIQS